MLLLALASGCAVRTPPPTEPAATASPTEAPAATPSPSSAPATTEAAPQAGVDALLALTAEVMNADTAEARRTIERDLQRRFEATPSHDNRLRLSLVRALTAAGPEELESARTDLQALADGSGALSDGQRRLALLTLAMVEERLVLRHQIADLQRQIESLTEIEASLNPPPAERAP